MPRCAACTKHNVACDVTDHVVYSYETVQKLQDRIQELELELLQFRQQAERARSSNISNGALTSQSITIAAEKGTLTSSQVSQVLEHSGQELATIEVLAEEVGSLALGPMQQFSQQYSKLECHSMDIRKD